MYTNANWYDTEGRMPYRSTMQLPMRATEGAVTSDTNLEFFRYEPYRPCTHARAHTQALFKVAYMTTAPEQALLVRRQHEC